MENLLYKISNLNIKSQPEMGHSFRYLFKL